MKLTFINIGNGDSILIEDWQDGKRYVMLIDGGSAEAAEYEDRETGRIRALDFLEQRGLDHIDVMVSTHIHEDHLCGLLAVAEHYHPAELWVPYPLEWTKQMAPFMVPGDASESLRKFSAAWNDYHVLLEKVEAAGGVVRWIGCGMHPDTGCPGLTAEAFGPVEGALTKMEHQLAELLRHAAEADAVKDGYIHLEKSEKCMQDAATLDQEMNATSLMLLFEYAGRRILLTGDTDYSGYEKFLKKAGSDSLDVYKAGHHGQKNSVDDALMEALTIKNAVICASSDRRYDSAHPDTLKRLAKNGAALFFTDCPDVPPYTDGLKAHQAISFTIEENGKIGAGTYED